MKRVLRTVLLLVICACLLVGCKKDTQQPTLKESVQNKTEEYEKMDKDQKPEKEEPSTTDDPIQEDLKPTEEPNPEPSMPAEDPGEAMVTDAGSVKALVPAGWKAFMTIDLFSDDPNATDPTILKICKGGEEEYDLYFKPYIQINYYGPDMEMWEPVREWYENTEDIEPLQLGEHSWSGFTAEESGSKLAVLWAEDGGHKFQATIWLEVEGLKISLNDADVQEILSSVAVSESVVASSPVDSEQPALSGDYAWWQGQWYGWWCIINGSGEYEKFSNIAWDAYATIDVYDDGTGYLTLWDTQTTKDVPLVRSYISFAEGMDSMGALVADYGTFFDGGSWLPDVITVVPMDIYDWYVDPAASSVSHFDHMIEITGIYEDPENAENTMEYRFYLRPWGMEWEDVRDGDTSGCLYSDMMPLYYDDWYDPLLERGMDLPDSFEEGFSLVASAAAAPNPYGKSNPDASGEVSFDTLQAAYTWLMETIAYGSGQPLPTYEAVRERMGGADGCVAVYSSWTEEYHMYEWTTSDGEFLFCTFQVHPDGSEVFYACSNSSGLS